MPRRKNTHTKVKPLSPFQVILLLIQFILIKIGSLPLWLIKSILTICTTIVGYLKKTIPYTLYPIRRGRGRPRTTPFLLFYRRKIKKFIYLKTSHRGRVGAVSAFILFLTIFYTAFILQTSYQLPSPDRLVVSSQPLTTEIYDRNGKLLYRIYEGRNRTLVKLNELPKYLIQAIVSTEDKNFYKHPGFDPLAIARAIYHNLTRGSQEGASTITQQLIKNSLLTPDKTISRKVKEIILAFWAERIYSKNEILQMYVNEAPYGGPAWGIEAAAQTYFGKGAHDLNLAEAAFLAGLPASPTQYSPYGSRPELAKVRQAWVLDRMVKERYISKAQRDEALNQTLDLKPPSNNILAPHFVFYVKDLLAAKFGERVVSQGGLKIKTTLDLELQKEAEKIVAEEVNKLGPLNVRNGALMITDAKTGQILAMVGSRDYHYPDFGNFNVTLSLRQPGSSIKVVTYSTAFKKGFSPGNTVLDTPVTFRDEWGNSYAPKNYDGSYHGPVSIRTALGSSLNVPAVKMLATLGVDSMVATARDLGITTFTDPKNYGLALTLGGADVKMIEMMGVYGTLSQMGRLNRPTPILKVTDSSGNVLEEYANSSKQALESEVAYLITSILSDNKARTPAFGSNSLLNISSDVAVKTGTSDNKKDNWTFGYSKDFVVGVWVGNNDSSHMNPALTSGVTGAAPIWNKITKLMLERNPASGFIRPQRIVEVTLDGRKDLAIAGNVPKGLVRVRQESDKITFSDSFSSFSTPSALPDRQAGQARIEGGATN